MDLKWHMHTYDVNLSGNKIEYFSAVPKADGFLVFIIDHENIARVNLFHLVS